MKKFLAVTFLTAFLLGSSTTSISADPPIGANSVGEGMIISFDPPIGANSVPSEKL
ncbi:hypothetical protein M3936_16560 [Sutcliffiella horikoshii]|uniref:hypothetical protein n=1 Tax=Sutcliffiella horikoshii TaxID=79883 RepID=UPI0020418676|nr:hypothetical protein [Sutcliffiella horikoshii]MCM3619203.1 hypothetical protein [Sutcliffiella horikoshii]